MGLFKKRRRPDEEVQYFDPEPTEDRRVAYRLNIGNGPMLVFLPGYMSDMAGSKAEAIMQWAIENQRACLLLDYSGCGKSDGNFADVTFSLWSDDTIDLIEYVSGGPVLAPVVLVGSSMGGWMMLLIAKRLMKRHNDPDVVAGIVGIAAAPDFTEWGFTEAQKSDLAKNGVIYEDNPYGPEPTPTYLKLWQDGQANRLLGQEIAIDCPIRLLHGQRDADVPWQISMQLAENLRSDDVQIRLVKDGDHRLSRPQDIDLLIETVSGLIL